MVTLVPVEHDPFAAAPPGGFDSAVDWVLKTEGGYVANDAGKGPTNMGINSAANPDVDVKNLTPEKAKARYKTHYWDAVDADNLPPALATVAFDTAVNMGPAKAKTLLAQAEGDPARMIELRRGEYQRLAEADPKKYGPHLEGWNARLDGLQEQIAPAAQEQPEQPAPPKLVPVEHDPFAEEGAPPAAPEIPQHESLIAGMAQGGSFGMGDEMMAGMMTPVEYVGGKAVELFGGKNPFEGKSPVEIYHMTRDRIRRDNAAARAANPATYATGEITGAVATGGKLPIRSIVGQGAVYGYGASEKETAGGQALDTVTGAALAKVGQKVGEAALNAPKAVARSFASLFGISSQAADDFAKAGVSPSVAAVSERPGAKMADQFLSKFPGGAGRMRSATDKTVMELEKAIDNLGGSKAVTAQEAGATIQKGAEGYINKFRALSDRLYQSFDDLVPKNTQVVPGNLKTAIADEIEPFARNPEFIGMLPKTVRELDEVFRANPDKPIPYALVKKLRTEIGQKLSKAPMLPDESHATLSKLYGALTEDMRSVAQGRGQDALNAFDRANGFYRRGAQEIEKSLEKVVANKYPEQVFTAAMSGTKQGGSKIAGIWRTMDNTEREVVRGTVLKQMGLATPGQQNAAGNAFSAQTFLTNWSRMSPEAKKVIFGGGNSQYRQSVDRLARITDRMAGVQRFANTSNTGPYLGTGTVLAGGAFVTPKIFAALPAGYGAARLMTSKSFVDWMARAAQAGHAPAARQKLARELAIIAQAEPEIRDYAKEVLANWMIGAEEALPAAANQAR